MQPQSPHRAELAGMILGRAWLPIPVLLLTLAWMWVADVQGAFQAPMLLLGLNLIFLTLTSLSVAFLLARSFLVRGTPGLLLIGCGAVLWGSGGLLAIAVGGSDLNAQVTTYNFCAWLSSVCHLGGACLSLQARPAVRAPALWLPLAYTLTAAAMGLISLVVLAGWTPTFFVQGQGGTPVRQLLLGSAIIMFVATAVLLWVVNRHPLSAFLYWYTLGLGLSAVGLFGVLLQASYNSPLSWVGRATQYLGGVYMLVAALACGRESRAWGISLEAALQQSEDRYRSLFETMQEGFLLLEVLRDPSGQVIDGRCLEANPAAQALVGRTADKLLGRTLTEVWPGTQARAWIEQLGRVTAKAGAARLEQPAPNGRNYSIIAHAPLPGQLAVLLSDVTERVRAEADLRESEARFRALADNIAQLVWMANARGRIVWFNQRWFEYTGARFDEMQDGSWQKLQHPESAQRVTQKFESCISAGTSWEDTFRLRSASGEYRWFLSRAIPLRNDEGQVVRWFGTHTDVTEQRQAEEALHQAQTKLRAYADDLEHVVARRTAKLQETVTELEHFSYAIVHDLRAPLRAMQGFAVMLEEESATGNSTLNREYLRRIREASNRMNQLIADSLSYSKVTREEFILEPVNLGTLLASLIETYPNLLPDKAEIRVEPPLPTVLGNEAALTQCFSNLLGNAVKFARPGTRPRVRVWAETRVKPNPAEADNGPSGASAIIWVEDEGIGIPQDSQERIFEMFERAHHGHEGTGIGLAIVKKVVQRMQGSVGVQSEEGKGSRFWVELRLP